VTAAAAPPQAAAQPAAGTPYVGLVPYREEDAAFFFGRDRENEIVTGNLRAAQLTIVYGASGVGKSSLLEAGVIHDLHREVLANAVAGRERPPFAICSFRAWRDEPLPALVEAIRAAAAEALGDAELGAWPPGTPLVDTLRAWTDRVRTLLVVLDQFEDYFLYHAEEDGEGTLAVELPRIVNDPNLRVHVLLSIREDAWAKLDRFKGRIPRLFANYVRIENLNRAAAREAIEEPVRAWNELAPPGERPYTVERPALVEAVIDATAAGRLTLAGSGDGVRPTVAGADAIEAPFLQLVMERIWRATVAAGSRELTLARLDELGGAERIVKGHLDDALGALTPAEQEVAADSFRYLVTSSKTKIAYSASDVAEWTGRDGTEISAVLEKLCRGESGRILRHVAPSDESEPMRYELFHDVLAEPIRDWRRGYDQERDRRAAFRRHARVLAVLLLVAVAGLLAAAAVFAYLQKLHADRATRSATSLALLYPASTQLFAHPAASLLLSLEAYRTRPSAQAESGMLSALESIQPLSFPSILEGGRGSVLAVAFSPDGRTLASSGTSGRLVLSDMRTRRRLGRPLNAHQGRVYAVAFSPDGRELATAGGDGTIRLWNVATRKPLATLSGHRGPVYGVVFSWNGSTLASAGHDGTVRRWSTRTHKQLGQAVYLHQGPIHGVAFSPNGRKLASAGNDGTVRLWNLKNPDPRSKPLPGNQHLVYGVVFSPDGRTLASAGADGTVRLWNVTTRQPVGEPLNGRQGAVHAAGFSPAGSTLASAGSDGTVVVWDLRYTGLGERLHAGSGVVHGVAFNPDGRTLVSAGRHGAVRVWDLANRAPVSEPLGQGIPSPFPPGAGTVEVAFSPDGRLLATAPGDGNMQLWDTRSGRPLAEIRPVSGIAFSPDGKTLAANRDGKVTLWPLGRRLGSGRQLGASHESAYEIAFSPDGQTLAAAGRNGPILLWNARTRTRLGQLDGDFGQLGDIAFSPDGQTLASASLSGDVLLWDVRTRRQLGLPLNGHQRSAYELAFSPHAAILAVGGRDGTVALWDTRTQTELGNPLNGRQGSIHGVAFSPDGRTLATGGQDGTVLLWDVGTRSQIGQPLNAHKGPIQDLAFSPDGQTLAAAGPGRDRAGGRRQPGIVMLWHVDWGKWPDLRDKVCRSVVGNFTPTEWDALAPNIRFRSTCPAT
jgi:WD40 repeat protein